MKRHIKVKHPEIYEKEELLSKDKTASGKEEVFILEYIEDESLLKDIAYITTSEGSHRNKTEKALSSNDDSSTDVNDFDNVDTGSSNCNDSNVLLVSKKGRVKWGWVKKYIRKIDDCDTKCLICSSILRLPPGTYGNMKRHIKNKHPNVYKKEMSAMSLQENEAGEIKTSKENKKNDGDEVKQEQSIPHDDGDDEKNVITDATKTELGFRVGWAKDYCMKLDDEHYRCTVCSAVLRMRPGMYCNMKRHIRSKHPHIYEKERQCSS